MKKERPKIREVVGGTCLTCWNLSIRANEISCFAHGLPRNADVCKNWREVTRKCECGARMFFEEVLMPHPYNRNEPGFPSGHYLCDSCNSIQRSATADGKYASWVESFVLQHQPKMYKKVRLKENI